ncbi:hypothetical protein IAR50_003822 [Cryptococcus sp. DSM 104548]
MSSTTPQRAQSPFESDAPSASSSTTRRPPSATYPANERHVANRKSTASIRRKPVPVSPTSPEFALELSHLSEGTPSGSVPVTLPSPPSPPSAPSEPPVYVLSVDPTPTAHAAQVGEVEIPTRPPAYSGNPPRPQYPYDLSLGAPSEAESVIESLPTYEEESTMEPKTLAKTLWLYGFLCPLLWLIGMAIMCIPLSPVEEEVDPERAQKLDEMIVILRKCELKYARRCAWSFGAFSTALALVIMVAVVVSMRR